MKLPGPLPFFSFQPTWTTKTPTKPGLYWYKDHSDGEPILVSVTEIDGVVIAIEQSRLFAHPKGPVDGLDGEWQGPLAMPSEKFALRTWTLGRPTQVNGTVGHAMLIWTPTSRQRRVVLAPPQRAQCCSRRGTGGTCFRYHRTVGRWQHEATE